MLEKCEAIPKWAAKRSSGDRQVVGVMWLEMLIVAVIAERWGEPALLASTFRLAAPAKLWLDIGQEWRSTAGTGVSTLRA